MANTPRIVRPILPAPPTDFGRPVEIPKANPGLDAVVYAGRLKLVALEMARRLKNDAAFYDDVQRDFGNAQGQ